MLGAGVGAARPAGAPAGPPHQPSAAPPPLQLPAGPPWQHAGPQQAGRPPLLGSHRTPALPTPGLPPAQPSSRPATAGPHLQPLPAVPGLTSGTAAGAGLPMGRVSQAAAEMRAQPAAAGRGLQGAAAAPDLQHLVAQLQQERDRWGRRRQRMWHSCRASTMALCITAGLPICMKVACPVARCRLQQQLGSVEGTNKLLRSNLDQAERDRMGLRCAWPRCTVFYCPTDIRSACLLPGLPKARLHLPWPYLCFTQSLAPARAACTPWLGGRRQRLQQLEAKAPAPGPQSSFTLAEMQKQLEALKQQLMFKEQEVGGSGWWVGGCWAGVAWKLSG